MHLTERKVPPIHSAVMRGPEQVEALKLVNTRVCMFSHALLQESSITLYPLPASFCSLKLSPSPSGKRLLWNPFHINYFLFPHMPCNQSGWLTMNNLAFQICLENRIPKFCLYHSWSTCLRQHAALAFHIAELKISLTHTHISFNKFVLQKEPMYSRILSSEFASKTLSNVEGYWLKQKKGKMFSCNFHSKYVCFNHPNSLFWSQ